MRLDTKGYRLSKITVNFECYLCREIVNKCWCCRKYFCIGDEIYCCRGNEICKDCYEKLSKRKK